MLHAQCDQCFTKVERLFSDEERKRGIGMVTTLTVLFISIVAMIQPP